MAELYWSTHTPQLARMAPSSHPGHGDGHTLGNGNGLPSKLRAGSQKPSVKGYNIFPCSVFPEWTKPNPSTAVAVFQGYGALVKLEGPTPHPVDFQLVTETSTTNATATTAPEQLREEEVEFHLPDRVNRRQRMTQRPINRFLSAKARIRLATWNVRTLYQSGKCAQVARETKQVQTFINKCLRRILRVGLR